MARGKFYTEEENKVLKALCEDNNGLKFIDLARLAQKYGICANRNIDALAGHISELLQPQKDDATEDDTDMRLLIVEKERDELKRKYETVCHAVIGSAELFDNNNNALKLNLQAIRTWMNREEPERVNARLEELQL